MKTKTNFIKIVLSALVIAFVFTSCDKDDDENTGDEQQVQNDLIKQVKYGSTVLLDFQYDGDNKLIKRTISETSGDITIEYTYDNGKITGETAKEGNNVIYQYIYSYSNSTGDLIKCDIVGADAYWQFGYNNGKMTTAIKYIGGGESTKQTFNYSGDNIIEAKEYYRYGGIWELQESYEYEYDSKNNPFSELNIPFFEVIDEFVSYTCPHNISRRQAYDQAGVLPYDETYTYTYNANSYPLTATDNNGNEYTFIY